MILLSLGNSMGSFLFIFHSLGGAYMKNKIYIAFGVILCIIFATSCFNNNTTNSAPSTSFISENESSKNNDSSQEMVTITFKQYSCDIFIKEGNEVVIELYDELISTTVKEFEKGYYLSYKELGEISMSLNYVVPELGGDGYWSFTPFYYNKDLLDEGGVLRDTYLNEDLIVYYGIYG